MSAQPASEDAGAELLRRFFRRYAASAAVITVHGERPMGFTATSLASVSIDPPLLSFGIATTASCWPVMQRAEHFGVHLLGHDQEALAGRFARRGVDRFAAPTQWRPGPFGVPLLGGVLAWAVCRTVARVPAGDHVIVLGEPVAVDHVAGSPLVHHNGGYRPLR
jgi:flavin reductase (DIM6/NTAB) family NADH-FMN oxidoreductase RutF